MDKLPKNLEPEDVYNKLLELVSKLAEQAEKICAEINQAYASIQHINSRACGMCEHKILKDDSHSYDELLQDIRNGCYDPNKIYDESSGIIIEKRP